MKEILQVPLILQVALGGGFLAYMVAAAGLRRSHNPTDILMQSIAFGLPAMGVFLWLAPLRGELTGAFIGVLTSLIVGGLWRAVLKSWSISMIHGFGVHRDDFYATAWDSLLDSKDFNVTQVKVLLKSGVALHLENAGQYTNGPYTGLIVGTDGDLLMVVEGETAQDGSKRIRKDVTSALWGTRMTYVPRSEIERVEFRCLPHELNR